MAGRKVVILGSSFAGLTAALELRTLAPELDVVVLSKSRQFVFSPALLWVPFGLRTRADITFDVAALLESKGIRYLEAVVAGIDLAAQRVRHNRGTTHYDYLVLATGPELDFAAVPGLAPEHGLVDSIFGLDAAEATGVAFEALRKTPGPVVVGAVPGASAFGVTYELLFQVAHQLQRAGLRDRAPLTFVTPEPFVGHLGVGGLGSVGRRIAAFMERAQVTAVVDAAVREARPGELLLDDGRALPFRQAILTPAFRGIAPVRALTDITDASGFVRVDETYRCPSHRNVFAAGACVSVAPPDATRVPCAVPRTGYASEAMARIVAHNVVADQHGLRPIALAPGEIDVKDVLDAGVDGMILSADHLLAPRDHAWVIPGPEAHWAKLAFEKYFLATHRVPAA